MLDLFLLVLLAAGPGDARYKELMEQISKLQFETPKDRTVLEDAVKKYIEARDECFRRLVEIVAESSKDRVNQEIQWVGQIENLRDRLESINSDARNNLSKAPTVSTLAFCFTWFKDEDGFLEALSNVRVAEARDEIVRNERAVSEYSAKLVEKWSRLSDEDNRIDEQEKRVSEQIQEKVDHLITHAAEKHKTVKEKLLSWVSVVLKMAGGGSVTNSHVLQEIGHVAEGINLLIEFYLETNKYLRDRILNYGSLFGSEKGGIYVLFADFRRDTQEFLDKNKFDVVKTRYGTSKDAFDRLVSGRPDGIKSDAGNLGTEVLAKLNEHLKRSEEAQNKFVSEHKGKFFGPVGPDIENALAETETWKDRMRTLDGKDLDSQLRQWRKNQEGWWDVPLSGIPEVQLKQLKEHISARIENLLKALSEFEQVGKELRAEIRKRLEMAREVTK